MNRRHVISKIRELMAERYGITPAFVADDANIDSLGIDCLDRCEICTGLEEIYGITIEDEDCFESKTVADLAGIVVSRVAAKGSGR